MHQSLHLLVIFFGLFTVAFVLMPVANTNEGNVDSVKRVVLPNGKGRGRRSASQSYIDSLKRLLLPQVIGRGK